jgi:transposase
LLPRPERDANAARNIPAEGLRLLVIEQSAMVADGQPEIGFQEREFLERQDLSSVMSRREGIVL